MADSGINISEKVLKNLTRLAKEKNRSIYHVNATKYEVTVASIKHRKDIYE